MNILRQTNRLIITYGKYSIHNIIDKSFHNITCESLRHSIASTSISRYKSTSSQPETVSIYDIKDIHKQDIANKKSLAESFNNDKLAVKILRKIPFLKIDEIRIKYAGYFLYEDFVDNLDYAEFFEEFALPDTFYSWFVVTELHLWLLATRAMAEGDDGKILRNAMVECLWTDVVQRIKALGVMVQTNIKEQIMELSEQLQAAFIAYDEGLQSTDVVLAGAVWRRMYQMEDVHPEYLEKFVKYIRKQLVLLDNTSLDNLVVDKHVKWHFIK